jgi:excisionase family DNA binding protein
MNEPLLVNTEEAARLLGIGRTKCLTLSYAGEIPSKKLGRRRLFSVDVLRAYTNAPSQKDIRSLESSGQVTDDRAV